MNGVWQYGLLEGNLFHAPAFLSHQFLQAVQDFCADPGRVVGEIDQVAFAIFINLKAESVAPMEGDQCAKDRLDGACRVPCLRWNAAPR